MSGKGNKIIGKKYEQEYIIYCILSKPARQQRSRKTSTTTVKVPLFTRPHLQKREYVKANKRLLHACYLYAYTVHISLASAGGSFLDIHEVIDASTRRRHGGVASSESL